MSLASGAFNIEKQITLANVLFVGGKSTILHVCFFILEAAFCSSFAKDILSLFESCFVHKQRAPVRYRKQSYKNTSTS